MVVMGDGNRAEGEGGAEAPVAGGVASIYRDADHYDLLAQMTAPKDLPFYLEEVGTGGGPVLDLACGTGRIALAIAAQGLEVCGVDNSPAMLARAGDKAAAAGVALRLLEGDMRAFEAGGIFRTIVLGYNAFNHMLTLDDIARCLACVRRHMDGASRFVIDTFQPDLAFLAGDPRRRLKVVAYLDPYLGEEVTLTEQNRYEPASQINHITWYYEIGGKPEARVDELRMRIFFPQELDALLRFNGLRVEHKYGDYQRGPFSSRSAKQLMVCRLASP